MRLVVDNSVIQRLGKPPVLDAFMALARDHELSICTATLLEVGVSARNRDHYLFQWAQLEENLTILDSTPEIDVLALQIQGALIQAGQHRGPGPVDCIVAAHAQYGEGRVLHYDSDFPIIEKHAGVEQQWIVNRGSTS